MTFVLCERTHVVSLMPITWPTFTYQTHLTMVASWDLSKRCAASTAETMAPSRADRSHISSVTKNFRARLKKAAGPLEALTAMTCRGFDGSSGVDGEVLSDAWSLLAGGFLSDSGRSRVSECLGWVLRIGVVGSPCEAGMDDSVGCLCACSAVLPCFPLPPSVDILQRRSTTRLSRLQAC